MLNFLKSLIGNKLITGHHNACIDSSVLYDFSDKSEQLLII